MAEGTKKKKKGSPPVPPRNDFSEAVLRELEEYTGPTTITGFCSFLGISKTKYYEWRREHEAFDTAITCARDRIDDRVENALLSRALGYTYNEVTEATKSGDKDETISKIVRRELPPDVKAATHWLNNRRPDDWREKKTVEVTDSYHEKLKKFMGDAEDDAG